jgi:hypothetical protein
VGKVSKVQEKKKYTVNFVNLVNFGLLGRLSAGGPGCTLQIFCFHNYVPGGCFISQHAILI